jgi:hypothetical protein
MILNEPLETNQEGAPYAPLATASSLTFFSFSFIKGEFDISNYFSTNILWRREGNTDERKTLLIFRLFLLEWIVHYMLLELILRWKHLYLVPSISAKVSSLMELIYYILKKNGFNIKLANNKQFTFAALFLLQLLRIFELTMYLSEN